MKVGDLVTLSTYALQTVDLRKWSRRIWIDKRPLVGLVVKTMDNPLFARGVPMSSVSENEKTRYRVKWIQPDGPKSRYGMYGTGDKGFFLRNDLKFVRKGEFE
jgi:hypothetical protein|tara:strand:- start:308 stop:616 length:309 start_codon:yes stop_codon:yes gene_type:complete